MNNSDTVDGRDMTF